jgi:acyl-CoA hydrolase
MEVFVKIMGEDLQTGERFVGATAFLTFVALDNEGNPHPVPPVIPESKHEKKLHETAPERSRLRKERRTRSKLFAKEFGLLTPWT